MNSSQSERQAGSLIMEAETDGFWGKEDKERKTEGDVDKRPWDIRKCEISFLTTVSLSLSISLPSLVSDPLYDILSSSSSTLHHFSNYR